MLRRLEGGERGQLPPAAERWRRLLVDRNPAIRLSAESPFAPILFRTSREEIRKYIERSRTRFGKEPRRTPIDPNP
jgi:hypothetical protein